MNFLHPLAALLVVALLTSQSAIDLFSSLIFVVVVFVLAKRRDFAPARTGLGVLFGLWFVVLIAGYASQGAPPPVWQKGLGTFRWLLEFLALVALWRLAPPTERAWRFACGAFMAAGAYSLLVYALGFNPLFEGPETRAANLADLWRSGGFYGEAMAWAHTLGPVFALSAGAGFILRARKNQLWRWFAGAAVLTGVAVLFTMTRGVWIAAAVALPAMAFLLDWKKGLAAVGAVLLAAAVVLALVPSVRERALFTLNFQRTHDSERLVLWKANLHIFSDSPWVGWGYGENQRRLREAYDQVGVPDGQFTGHAHNQYLHMLAGTGALGLACYLAFWFFLLTTTVRWFHRAGAQGDALARAVALGVFGALVLFLVGGLTEANFSIAKNRMTILVIASLAVAARPWQRQRAANS